MLAARAWRTNESNDTHELSRRQKKPGTGETKWEERAAAAVIHRFCESRLRYHALLSIEGLNNLPAEGPVLLVCRHAHYSYDGCSLIASVPRPVHLVVSLDWLPSRFLRNAGEAVCRAIGWSVVVRPGVVIPSGTLRKRTLRSIRDSLQTLHRGGVLAIFPEGYPNVDPVFTPKKDRSDFLPFHSGFAVLADAAERRFGRAVPLVPVGFDYVEGERWRITMRLGTPVFSRSYPTRDALVHDMELRVKDLSGPAPL